NFEFTLRDVATFVLLEPEHEEPAVAMIGGDQRPCASALAPPRNGNALLEHAPAQVCVHQAGGHLRHRDGQRRFRYRTPAQPPRECAGHENPFHALTLSLSVTAREGSLPYSTATNGGAVHVRHQKNHSSPSSNRI